MAFTTQKWHPWTATKHVAVRPRDASFREVRRCAEALRRGVQLPVAEPEVLEAELAVNGCELVENGH